MGSCAGNRRKGEHINRRNTRVKSFSGKDAPRLVKNTYSTNKALCVSFVLCVCDVCVWTPAPLRAMIYTVSAGGLQGARR